MNGYIELPRWLKKNSSRIVVYIFLGAATILIFVPIVILLFGSVKTTGQMYSHPYSIPNPPNWDNIIFNIKNSPVFGL